MDPIEILYRQYLNQPVVTTDSRNITPGCIFFALRGSRVDGHTFAAQSLANGAALVVIEDEKFLPAPQHAHFPRYVLVPDVLKALQDLARHHRRQFHIPVIGITGSNGKTTTKELISAVLSSHYPTHYTKGNFNNHLGLPLTLLSMPAETEVAVIEMGASIPGDIELLCNIAEPTHGLITNIGKAHLEGLGGLEGVKKEKSALYRFLALTDGMAFINMNEPYLAELAQPVYKKLYYTQSEAPSLEHRPYEIKLLSTDPFVSVAFLDDRGEGVEVHSQLIGTYNFPNIMTAIVLGRYFKVPMEKIKAAIEQYIPSNNRSQIVDWQGNMLIKDAYNANPNSMRAALENLSRQKASKKIAILGDMLELGEGELEEHRQIIAFAESCGIPQILLVGPLFGAANSGKHSNFENAPALRSWWQEHPVDGACILLKGSRGMRLETLLEPAEKEQSSL